MKGLQGMIVAAGLGIIGAICNWFYISQQALEPLSSRLENNQTILF